MPNFNEKKINPFQLIFLIYKWWVKKLFRIILITERNHDGNEQCWNNRYLWFEVRAFSSCPWLKDFIKCMNTIIRMWDIASRQNDIIVRACVICLDPNKCRLWISLCTILQNVDRDQIYIMCNYNLKDTMVLSFYNVNAMMP